MKPFPPDSKLAESFLNLEDKLCLARDAVVALELIFDQACNPGEMGSEAARRLGWDAFRILVLTPDQFEGVHYVMRRARDEADALRAAYYASLGTREAQ